jgi:hypothetical protein
VTLAGPIVVVLMATAVASSGCFLFEQCGFSPDGAVWRQAGLHDALPESLEGRAVAVLQPDHAESGSPLLSYVGPRGPVEVVYVDWRPDGLEAGTQLWIEENGSLAGRFFDESEPEIAAHFRHFAENVTNGTDAEIEAWVPQFVENTRPEAGYMRSSQNGTEAPSEIHYLDVGDRLEFGAHPLLMQGELALHTPHAGYAQLDWERWSMAVHVPLKEWRATGETLRVDVLDQVEFHGSFDVDDYHRGSDDKGHPEYERRLRDRFEELGLPFDPTGLELQGSIC